MVKIPPLSLFVINTVRLKRLILGLSSKKLSKTLGHSPNYVAIIESTERNTSYPPHEYSGLAQALGCQIHDLIPPDGALKSDGTKVEKRVLNFSNMPDVRLVIEGLIEADYFKEYKSIETLLRYLKLGNEEEANTVRTILNILVSEKILIQTEEGYLVKQ